jgi:hypothetical protein
MLKFGNTSAMPEPCIPHEWPAELEPGLIPTSNAMGIMTREPAPVAVKFAEHAGRSRCSVLEIGAAYGNASYPALEAGGTVIACDLAEEELARLRGPVPPEMQKRLITIAGRFPEQLHFYQRQPECDPCRPGLPLLRRRDSPTSTRDGFSLARVGRRKTLLGRDDAAAQLVRKVFAGLSAAKRGW